jgi:PKD domain-containing protein
MSAMGSTRKALGALMGAFALFAGATLGTTALAAPVPHPRVGKLPDYPLARGVIPVLGSQVQLSAREKLVKEAFAAVARRRQLAPSAPGRQGGAVPQHKLSEPVPNRFLPPECPLLIDYALQDVCYQGGPVLRGAKVHLIFWQGVVKGSGSEAQVEKFPAGYEEEIERYFADVAHDSGLATNVFAIDGQYFSEEGITQTPGRYSLSFYTEAERVAEEKRTGKPVEHLAYKDPGSFPTHTTGVCPGPSVLATGQLQKTPGPCLLDLDLHTEVSKAAAKEAWSLETVKEGSTQAGNMFVVITPPGVGGCFQEASSECAYTTYCAYHGDFGGTGETPNGQTVYENIPYIGGVGGCEILKVQPTKVQGADAAIDAISHESNESITDPLGSQCKEEVVGGEPTIVGCEPFSWTDSIGQEVGDKCLPPEVPTLGPGGIYGEPLGPSTGLLPQLSSYNQVIDSDHYWTQREWSNAASAGGGCVQRLVHSQFTAPGAAKATVPATFDGSASGEGLTDQVEYWVWSWGDGMQTGTFEPTASHTYATAGTYSVTLTVYDIYGNSNTFEAPVSVGQAPPPTPAPEPQVITKTVSVPTFLTPTSYTIDQLARKLGLPANKATLSGLGTISLGHAECPPACKVSLKLYANVSATTHGKRVVKHELIGLLTTTIATKGTGKLALTLNANGRKLLAKSHKLAAQLVVTVTGQEGGSWQIVRALTLTSSGKAAHRPRR